MDWKLISLGSFGVGLIVVSWINSVADANFVEASKEKALNQRDPETERKLQDAKKNIELANELTKRESKEKHDELRNWKRENNYDSKIRDIHDTAVSELIDFKASIGYYDRKKDIEDEYEDALEAFKESIDYDYEAAILDAEIEDAKLRYKNRCKKIEKISAADDDISEALSNIKKSEKEKMEETIKNTKTKISSLESKLSQEETKLNRKKQADLRELESELQATKTRLNKEEADKCKVLNAEKDKIEEEIRKKIIEKRSAKETKLLDQYDEYVNLVNQQKTDDALLANDIYKNTPQYEKWAEWLKKKDCPKWLFIFMSALPIIPAGFLLKTYVTFVYRTAKAM